MPTPTTQATNATPATADNVVTIKLVIPEVLCVDLLTTAFEGGSAYWLACDHPVRDIAKNVIKIVGCYDREDEDEKWPDADLATMRLGIKRILEGEGKAAKVRSDIRADILSAVLDPHNTDWDADTADIVLQVGLLGEVVYG